MGSARFSSKPNINRDAWEISAGVCGQCELRASRRLKTRLDFLLSRSNISRIEQAKGLAQIEQNGIPLSVLMQAEPVWTVRTSAQHVDRYDLILRETYETSNYNR